MDNTREKIIILEPDPGSRDALLAALQGAATKSSSFATSAEALRGRAAIQSPICCCSISRCSIPTSREVLATIRGSAATAAVRVILLVGAEALAARRRS